MASVVVGMLSVDAASFVAKHIASPEVLEVVVAIASAPEQTTIIQLVQTTRLPASIVRNALRELERTKLAETTSRGTVCLTFRNARERALLSEILDQYDKNPSTILRAVARSG